VRPLLALLLAGCVEPLVRVDGEPPPDPEPPYVATAEATTQRRVEEVAAEARCDEGDLVTGGGCTWGQRRAPERAYPLEAIENRPSDDGAGWLCVGQQDGVGVELEVLRAWAVCAVAPPAT